MLRSIIRRALHLLEMRRIRAPRRCHADRWASGQRMSSSLIASWRPPGGHGSCGLPTCSLVKIGISSPHVVQATARGLGSFSACRLSGSHGWSRTGWRTGQQRRRWTLRSIRPKRATLVSVKRMNPAIRAVDKSDTHQDGRLLPMRSWERGLVRRGREKELTDDQASPEPSGSRGGRSTARPPAAVALTSSGGR
jgi:hypothetical protein